ncbi:hypothetical protein FB451DRAFT_1551299 [Mycena latifolia]|nr:hypothetical protein FB451DRAFT_1551299 [Mycena latifolia]
MSPSPTDRDINAFNAIQFAWAIAAAEVFHYGVYVVLFCFYMHILRKCGMATHRFLTGATISLFILCTAHCALELAMPIVLTKIQTVFVEHVVWIQGVYRSIIGASNMVYVTSNVIADSIFIFRCYGIWNFRRKIVIFPIILTLAGAGLGYVNAGTYLSPNVHSEMVQFLFVVSVSMSLVTTFVLIGLTVGRIWWLARAAQQVMGRKTTTAAILGQLVGIAPTIIAVRVGLGYSVDNVDSFIAPKPRARPPPQNPVVRSMQSVEERIVYLRPDSVQEDMV